MNSRKRYIKGMHVAGMHAYLPELSYLSFLNLTGSYVTILDIGFFKAYPSTATRIHVMPLELINYSVYQLICLNSLSERSVYK